MKTPSETRQIHSLSPIHAPLKISPPYAPLKSISVPEKKANPCQQLKLDPSLTLAQQLEQVSRRQWISDAAYFKAEARGFAADPKINDWLEAEHEYQEMVVKLFLSEFKEDGEITIIGLQQLAEALGIGDAETIDSKLELIRLIQTACYHQPCFRAAPGEICQHQEGCPWSGDCQKLLAEWWC